METTLRALDENERAVLRLYFVEDLTIEQIAELYRVHHSTVSRWISRCRKSVLAETRRLLKERLALREDQVSSLVRAVRSQLDLSIGRLLTASPG